VDWWGLLRRDQSDDPSYGRFPELRHLLPEVAAFTDVATTPVSPVIPSWHGLRVFAFTNCTNCAVAAQELIERLTIWAILGFSGLHTLRGESCYRLLGAGFV
jgi:hypothetical protein